MKYQITYLGDSITWEGLKERLPNDDSICYSQMTLKEGRSENLQETDIVLFCIESEDIPGSIRLYRSLNSDIHSAVIGKNLAASEVVHLMRAGFAEVFDQSKDFGLLREWMIGHYEDSLKKASQPTVVIAEHSRNRIIGESDAIRDVRELSVQAAKYPELTVLIQGETGTGKEMVARLIHESSSRREGPFIEVNCSAIPETLMEAEMLGYEKGAFTDARRSKKGFFELANRGTLFLDEIGVMSPSLQNKILKIVEEKKFRRLGGEKELEVDTKIIAGTNEDLKAASEKGDFRPDLYYRLKVFTIDIPALRDRQEDILLLSGFFLTETAKRYNLTLSGIHPATEDMLQQYSWPGNVRELKHVIERACVVANRGRILPVHLPEEFQGEKIQDLQDVVSNMDSEQILQIPLPRHGISFNEIEKMIMKDVLKRCNGNQSKAARFLSISRTRLIRKLKE